jgi:hypothetical protein
LRILAAAVVLILALTVFTAFWFRTRALERDLEPLRKLGFGKEAGIALDDALKWILRKGVVGGRSKAAASRGALPRRWREVGGRFD